MQLNISLAAHTVAAFRREAKTRGMSLGRLFEIVWAEHWQLERLSSLQPVLVALAELRREAELDTADAVHAALDAADAADAAETARETSEAL